MRQAARPFHLQIVQLRHNLPVKLFPVDGADRFPLNHGKGGLVAGAALLDAILNLYIEFWVFFLQLFRRLESPLIMLAKPYFHLSPSLSSSRGGRRHENPGGKLVVKHQKPLAVVADQLQLADDLPIIFLFFHLLSDKPLQEYPGGMVLPRHGQIHKVIDAAGYHLLMGQGFFEKVKKRVEFRRHYFPWPELDMLSLAVEIIVKLHEMNHLFLVLDHEPVGRTLEPP